MNRSVKLTLGRTARRRRGCSCRAPGPPPPAGGRPSSRTWGTRSQGQPRARGSSRHVEDAPRRHELAAAAREVPAAAADRVSVHVLRPVHETAVAAAAQANVVDRTHEAGGRTPRGYTGDVSKEPVSEVGNKRTGQICPGTFSTQHTSAANKAWKRCLRTF